MVSRSCISGYGTNFVPALNIHRAAGAAGAGLRPARGGGAAARALLVLAAAARGLGRPPERPGPAADAAAAEPDGVDRRPTAVGGDALPGVAPGAGLSAHRPG